MESNSSYDAALIGGRLKTLRAKKGMSQQDIADQMNISRSYYAAFEQGNKRISFEMASSFASLFGVSLNWLLYGDTSNDTNGNVTGYKNGNVDNTVHFLEEAGMQYYSEGVMMALEAKDKTISALQSEIEALKEIIALLKEKISA